MFLEFKHSEDSRSDCVMTSEENLGVNKYMLVIKKMLALSALSISGVEVFYIFDCSMKK